MLSMTKNIKHLILAVICFGLILKYTELRHSLSVRSAADRGSDSCNEDKMSSYQTNSNVTFMAQLAEKFPPRIRDYFLNTERPFLRKDGKERFFDYFRKTYPNPDEKLKYQMSRVNETWHQRLPSAIIIGCKKCGTTFLKDVLIRHPFVAMAETENGHFIMKEKYEQGWPFYRSEMAYSFPDQITMEKSPLYWPVTGTPRRIYDYNPDVKLILAVRDPACRIASDFFFGQKVVGYVSENVSFVEAMTAPEHQGMKEFLGDPSRYGPIIKQWLEYFPLENFKIIRNEDMLSLQVKDVLADLEDFLGIPHGVSVVAGPGREICITQPVHHRNFCFNATLPQDLPCKYYRQYPAIMEALKNEYMPFAKEFSEIIKRDFKW